MEVLKIFKITEMLNSCLLILSWSMNTNNNKKNALGESFTLDVLFVGCSGKKDVNKEKRHRAINLNNQFLLLCYICCLKIYSRDHYFVVLF